MPRLGRIAPVLALVLLAAGPALAYDDLVVEEKALRIMDTLVPPDTETKEEGMKESRIPGWIKVAFQAKSRRGWIPINIYVHEKGDYALVGRLYGSPEGADPREAANKAADKRLPDRFSYRLIKEQAAGMEGLREVIMEVEIPQRGKRPMAVYVGEGFAAVGQLFGPDNQNLTQVALQRWRADQVAWQELVKDLKPAYGSPDAPVRFAMFTDPDCPSCQKAKARIDQMIQETGDRMAGYLLWLPLDMHPHAKPKAKVLACSPAGRQQGLFDALKGTEPEGVKDVYAVLEDKGMAVPEAVRQCVSSGRAEDRLARFSRLAERVGVSSVPTVYFDDRVFRGFPEQELRRALPGE
mgnify:CR=1 FL=1